jgi:hypothetical protein
VSELHKRRRFIMIPWTKSGLVTSITHTLTGLYYKSLILYGYLTRLARLSGAAGQAGELLQGEAGQDGQQDIYAGAGAAREAAGHAAC